MQAGDARGGTFDVVAQSVDIVGVQIANAIAAGLRHARDAGREFAETTAEYLTEESRDVVPRAELDAFHDAVDTLRDDAARLSARVARLHAAADPLQGRPG